jgi:hypothetical protein
MTDYYHFFGLKNKENRFMMRVVNPFAFDINVATFRLSELFNTYGSCPSINDITISPWKANSPAYLFWYVTPNVAGLIKSNTPTITLDGVDYLGYSIYLLSLPNYVKVYANGIDFAPLYWQDSQTGEDITGRVVDFIPACLGAFDPLHMSGIYYNLAGVGYDWSNVKPWCESGNIFVSVSDLANDPITMSHLIFYAGDIITVLINDVEISPIGGKQSSIVPSSLDLGILSSVGSLPSGWTYRPLIRISRGGTNYVHCFELIHTSGGRYIHIPGVAAEHGALPGWWYPIIAFQYPLMKYSGVSAYYVE